MTKEHGKITFYDINRCGYYKRGTDFPEFGDAESILPSLRSWAFQPNMTLEQTCTYEVGEHKPAYRTFCFDLVSDTSTNSYLLTTWNEVPSSANKIAAVRGLDRVGEAAVSLTDLPQNSIPGYATYFWLLPGKKLMATIQFQHNTNGRKNMEAYMSGFLTKFSMNVVANPSSDGTIVLEYGKGQSYPYDKTLSPQFKSLPRRKLGQIEYIRNNWAQIRKIIRKETISFNVEQQVARWQKLLQSVGVSQPQFPSKETEKFSFDLNYSPSEGEIEEMLNFWRENEDSGAKWDDLGFKMEGETDIRWLSHCLAKENFELDIARYNDEIVDAQSLLDQLVLKKSVILKLLD
jgi:hypothetical protein